MGDAGAARAEELDVGVVDEDAMGGDQAAVEEADGLEVLDRRAVVVAAQVGDLVGHLRDVHQHGSVEFLRETRDFAEAIGFDGVRCVRREGRGDQRVAPVVGDETPRAGDAAVGFGGVRRGEIDDRLPEHGAHAGEAGGARDLLLEVVHVGEGRHAALDHLHDAVQRAPVHDLAVDEVLLEREDEAPQAVGHVVAEPAEDGHGGVRVGVHHARQYEGSARVEGAARGEACRETGLAHRDDAFAADGDHAVADHLATIVHRQHVAAHNQQIGGLGFGGGDPGGKQGGEHQEGGRRKVSHGREQRAPKRSRKRGTSSASCTSAAVPAAPGEPAGRLSVSPQADSGFVSMSR